MSPTSKPEIASKFADLKAELARLQKEYKDDGQYADPATWPKGGSDGPFDDKQPSGTKTVAEAINLGGLVIRCLQLFDELLVGAAPVSP